MPAFRVQASIEINAPLQRVHDTLVDFNTWPDWSPWLYIEPDAKISYTGNKGEPGHGYQWTGDKVGAGSMHLTGISPGRIDCNLEFLKPFKSTAAVWFDLTESSGNTVLGWSMDSQLPFFMFWMVESMTAMISADYKRGLALLKDQLETGSVRSNTKLLGSTNLDTIAYVGQPVNTSFDRLQSSNLEAFSALNDKRQDGLFATDGSAFCIYEKMNLKRDEINCIAALPVAGVIPVDAPLVSGLRPACRALHAVHTGPYKHLPNAWAMLKSEAQSKKLKLSKTLSPVEYYLNDSDTTDQSELITEIYLPLRS